LVEDKLKLKFAAWLFCLFLFVSAVDTIPDPPAIKPSGSGGEKISSLHVRAPSTLLEKGWFTACNLPLRTRAFWLSLRPAFLDKAIAMCMLPRIHHMTDSSPPIFF
jgi:hypothetical protein